MKESDEMDNLLAARKILKSSIEQSRNISIAVNKIGSIFAETSHNLAFLEAAIKDVGCKCAVYEIRGDVDRAIGPAAAVMKVLDLVYELQDSLETHPRVAGLFVYVNNIKRLQEALKLLADNSRLVMMWLDDVVPILESNADGGDDWYLVRVSKVMNILDVLQGKEETFREDGGVLSSALHKLEGEYRHILTETSFSSIQELHAITDVLGLERCISIYSEARIANARDKLRALDVDYMDIELCELDSVQTVEGYIDEWDKQMEFAVRHVLEKEYVLCNEVYHKFGADVWMECFAKIATQCGFDNIFNFGNKICKCKKEAVKLFQLLNIFSTLDKLRLDFNEMFSGKFCVKIQNQTRDLVKNVVYEACDIFEEFFVQVELLQSAFNPPLDGSVPRLVYFVTQYCNQLLEEENSVIMIRVLEIYQLWNGVEVEEGLLYNEIQNIMKALEINLETWARKYNDDTALSCFFMMNNYWYLCNSLRGTKLGDLMGNSSYEESLDYFTALYMKESSEKLLALLSEEGLTLFPGGRAIDRNLVRKRISLFCEAFDDMYKKQSQWTLSDQGLRWKTCQLIVEAIVPPYKSYLQKYMPGIEEHVKYSDESLEDLIGSLFQLKIGKYRSKKCINLIGIKNDVHLSSTPAAA
ncbi:hypothetical protein BUALT_Bualt02G0128800 [Buddleja alternifolia]|uniref:Exocyst subunit Exo70 family protein n=1 Tax=Buddleja alternifolia TaxID=168488 RepID=A0AAV6Y5Z9_9LAMI|nr:hypothetical protein BUALT_Bualt02G0128800 [Buddleja alternifolia]